MELRDEIRDYWNLRSEGFSESVLDEVRRHGEDSAASIMKMTGIRKGSKVLDIGCGPGYFSMILSSCGMHVTGIDYSDKMVAEARRNAENAGIEAQFMQMDAQALDFPSDSFDLIVSRNVLWNLTGPDRAYAEMYRVLAQGGKAYISDGNFYLHHHDPDYLLAHQEAMKRGRDPSEDSHNKFNRGRVDFSIIDNLADDLPLSHEERPYWDLRTLTSLGCSSVNITYPAGRAVQVVNGRRIIGSFEIVFAKGERP